MEFIRLDQIGQRFRCIEHGAETDIPGAGIEQAAEDTREDEGDVERIRKIGASGRDDARTGGFRQRGVDFRIRDRESEDDRILVHRRDHLFRDDTAGREPDEHIGAAHHRPERSAPVVEVRFLGDVALRPVHSLRAVFVDGSGAVANHQAFHSGPNEETRDTDACDTGAADHDADVFQVLAGDFERVEQAAEDEHRGPVVLVRENRNVGGFFEMIGDRERVRRGDIIDTDRAESGGDSQSGFNDPHWIIGGKADRKSVDAGERFKNNALRFGNGQCGFRRCRLAAEQIGAVRQDRDRVPATGVIERKQRIAFDFKARFSHTGCVDERKHFGVANRNLAGNADEPLVAAPEIQPLIVDRDIVAAQSCAPNRFCELFRWVREAGAGRIHRHDKSGALYHGPEPGIRSSMYGPSII